jgi:hypothetical protein
MTRLPVVLEARAQEGTASAFKIGAQPLTTLVRARRRWARGEAVPHHAAPESTTRSIAADFTNAPLKGSAIGGLSPATPAGNQVSALQGEQAQALCNWACPAPISCYPGIIYDTLTGLTWFDAGSR